MPYLEVNLTSPVPAYQQIMDQIRALVSGGTLPPGRPLPSVRQLAEELGVNPNTVAKAYQLLEVEGTILTVRRRGAFVGEGSSGRAALAKGKRVAEVVDRLLDEVRRLGVGKEDIVQALASREEDAPEARGPRSEATDGSPDGGGVG